MTPDQFRLDQAAAHTRLTGLSRELPGLRGLTRFMMSGAHPDDECAPMMAALYFRDGVGLSYACSTRGEGGQNDIGTQRGPALGALRTAEMEAACDVLSMRMYWLSQDPEDTITDWRFSKSGDETLAQWGYDRTLRRMVEILRRDRPDVLCPTFLDVPGQHGHHRAMTRIAHDAFDAAADPGFDTGQMPWAVSKLYLPAWSGAGRAYDDDTPPPPATVTIPGDGHDPWTGHSYALLGAMSHGHHRSQGMGHWPDQTRDYPLHLAETRVGPDRSAVTDNLPHRFADIGLPDLDQMIDAVLADIALPAPRALREIHDRLASVQTPDHAHRIDAKRRQIARLLTLAAGQHPTTYCAQPSLRSGETTSIAGLQSDMRLRVPDGWQIEDTQLGPTTAPPERGYRDHYDPLDPPLPAVEVTTNGTTSLWPLSHPLLVAPQVSISLPQTRFVLNRQTGQTTITVPTQQPQISAADWPCRASDRGLEISATEPGQHRIPLLHQGQSAQVVQTIHAPHIRPTQYTTPAEIALSVIDVALPDHPVSYIGAGLDTVDTGLRNIGLQIDTPDTLDDLHPTLLIGIHAFRFNPALAQWIAPLHDWVRAGGKLVTLYHRPWDNWDPQVTPPLPLEIGQPSLRWRVTQKDAPVTILQPDHPVMTGPNRLSPASFDGWVKERGLYFAKSWDPAYVPLLACADQGEAPLHGGLLAARIGKGQHIHIALNLHHQLDYGVEGAIQLLVNCLQR